MSQSYSSNKFRPKSDDLEGQIKQLALLPQSDLNILGQIINLITYEPHRLLTYDKYLQRENIKRIYFRQVPTYDLKQFMESFPEKLTKEELDEYETDEEKQKAQEVQKERYDALHKTFDDMNKELLSKKLPIVD